MIQSLILGTLLGILYAVFVKKRSYTNAHQGMSASLKRHILQAFFRIGFIAALFFAVSKLPFLDVFVVLFSFITVITLFLFNLARKAVLPMFKTGGDTLAKGRL